MCETRIVHVYTMISDKKPETIGDRHYGFGGPECWTEIVGWTGLEWNGSGCLRPLTLNYCHSAVRSSLLAYMVFIVALILHVLDGPKHTLICSY